MSSAAESVSEVMVSHRIGSPWLSFFWTSGSSAISGRSVTTACTAARTSAAAWSMSRPGSKVMTVREPPSSASDEIVSIPAMPAMAPSITVVTSLSTTLGPAPR